MAQFCERKGIQTAIPLCLALTTAKRRHEVIKLKQTQAIHCPPAPVGVLEGSRADVSFLADLLSSVACGYWLPRPRPIYQADTRASPDERPRKGLLRFSKPRPVARFYRQL